MRYLIEDFSINLQLFASEKTEPATPRKRSEARKKGQVARTGELSTALLILAGFFSLSTFGANLLIAIGNLMRFFLESSGNWSGDGLWVLHTYKLIFYEILEAIVPFIGSLVLVAILAQGIQVGVMFNWQNIQFKGERINPIAGFKRIFSKRAIVEFFKSIIKILIIGYLAYRQIKRGVPWLPGLMQMDRMHALGLVMNTGLSLVYTISFSLLAVAIVDYVYQRWEFEISIRMSKQEVKEEFKETEGDPLIRSKIRQRQREIASRRMMEAVPTADVVITNPTHYAVALKYTAGEMIAPQVVAKGKGLIALRIKEIASEHDIPQVENPPLARELYRTVEVNQPIPAELYPAVAEVLAFVYRLQRNRRR